MCMAFSVCMLPTCTATLPVRTRRGLADPRGFIFSGNPPSFHHFVPGPLASGEFYTHHLYRKDLLIWFQFMHDQASVSLLSENLYWPRSSPPKCHCSNGRPLPSAFTEFLQTHKRCWPSTWPLCSRPLCSSLISREFQIVWPWVNLLWEAASSSQSHSYHPWAHSSLAFLDNPHLHTRRDAISIYCNFTMISEEKEIATYSSILAWRIPQTEEPGGLQSMGSQELDMT